MDGLSTLMELWASGHEGLRALAIALGAIAAGFLSMILFRRVILQVVSRTRTDIDDLLAMHLRWPVSWSIACGGLWWAQDGLMIIEPARVALQGGLGTITVLIWGTSLVRLSGDLLQMLVRRSDGFQAVINTRTVPAFDIGAKFLIYGGCAYYVFLAWNIDPTAWLASAGIAGIAVGFAAQQTLANVLAGVSILADGPYKLGDYLLLESGERGRVSEIGMRTTRLITNDDTEIIIPNAVMANSKIINQSGGPYTKARLQISVGVPYDADLVACRAALLAAILDSQIALEQPPPSIRLTSFADSHIEFVALFWIADPRFHLEAGDLTRTAMLTRLNEIGVQIPFPQRVIHHIGHPALKSDTTQS